MKSGNRKFFQSAIQNPKSTMQANRELIARFEQKLQAKLAEIWGAE